MVSFFILFVTLFINTISDINIFYGDEIEYASTEIGGSKKGGLPAAVGMMKKLKNKYPNQLFLLLNSNKNYKDLSKHIKILEKAGVKAILINSDFLKSKDISVPALGTNIKYSSSQAKPHIGYKNIFMDNMKISLIGIVSKDTELPQGYKHGIIKEELQLTLDLLDKTYSPDISIVISNSNDENILQTVQNRKRSTILIDNHNREDINSVQKYNMVSKKTEKNSLGLFSLQITNDKITDYKNIIVNLNVKNDKDIERDEKEELKMKDIEKKDGKKATKKQREELEKNIEKSSVEEDRDMKEFISENI